MSVGQTNPLRQQMINMMYLVLTALLALNVSAEILNAFASVNKGLTVNNISFESKTSQVMTNFEKVYERDKKKAERPYNNAQDIIKESDAVVKYIDGLKDEMAKLGGGGWVQREDGTEDKTRTENLQDLEASENYFVVKKEGDELKQRLEAYEKKVNDLMKDSAGRSSFQVNIDTEDPDPVEGEKKSWSEYYFGGVPVIAAITQLTKFQNDVRNAETEAVTHLFNSVGAEDVKFDRLDAIVDIKTPSVYKGQEFQADIFLGASSSTKNPKIVVNGSDMQVAGGKAEYKVRADSEGEKTITGKIIVENIATGEVKEYPFERTYQVFTGTATISATKMKMFYIGLENPVSVAVPGFRPDQISVTASQGANLKTAKTGAEYFVTPAQGTREITINVSVKMADGTSKQMGSETYKVRPVPFPEVLFGSKTGGAISRGELSTVNFVSAGLGASFAFEGLQYDVLGYQFVYVPRGGQAQFETVNGARVTPTMRGILNNARPGDMIIISEVKAKGPQALGTKILNGPSLTVR